MKDSSQVRVALALNPLNNPKVRAFVVQLAVLTLVGVAGWALIDNTITNLQRQNIASGFGFLENTAGFGIVQTPIEYSEQSSYGRALLVGLVNTLLVAAIGIVVATLIGFTLGVARLSPNWLVSRLATVYIETVRNVPLLLQLFFWYFAVLRSVPLPKESLSLFEMFFVNNRGIFIPSVQIDGSSLLLCLAAFLGVVLTVGLRYLVRSRELVSDRWALLRRIVPVSILVLPLLTFVGFGMGLQVEVPELRGFGFRGGWTFIPELVALVLSLSIYTAAFIAENVRSGILSVAKGQSEAARALGLPPGRVLRLIVIPQALRVVIPPLTSQYLNLTKNSSLAVAIAYPDLVSVFSGTVLNQTGQAVEVIAITMTIYLGMSLFISVFMNWYNRHMALVER